MSAVTDKRVRSVVYLTYFRSRHQLIRTNEPALTSTESSTFQEMVREHIPCVIRRKVIPNILDVVAPVEREIRSLANGLTSVKDEQEYIVVRERTHRNTAESTNARVKWWSVLQAIVLFSVVAWQVYYLKVCSTPCIASGFEC